MGLSWQRLRVTAQKNSKWIAALICLLAIGMLYAHYNVDQQRYYWQKQLTQVTDEHKNLNVQLHHSISQPSAAYDAKQALLLLQITTAQKPQAVYLSQFDFTTQSGVQIRLQSTSIKALNQTIEMIACLSLPASLPSFADIATKTIHQQHLYYYQMTLQPKRINRADCYA